MSNSSELKLTLWDKVTMPLYQMRNFIRDKWWSFRKRCQRFKRGYSDVDTWDIDCWFINTIKPMLEQFLNEHHGYPGSISNEEWEDILSEMINCLNLMDEYNAWNYLGISDDDYSLESHKKLNEFMETNKNRFFELFSKWFYCLWD